MASLAFLRLIIQPVTVSASYSSVFLEVLGAFLQPWLTDVRADRELWEMSW